MGPTIVLPKVLAVTYTNATFAVSPPAEGHANELADTAQTRSCITCGGEVGYCVPAESRFLLRIHETNCNFAVVVDLAAASVGGAFLVHEPEGFASDDGEDDRACHLESPARLWDRIGDVLAVPVRQVWDLGTSGEVVDRSIHARRV